MDLVTGIPELRARVAGWRREGRAIGLVPAMGGIHRGHAGIAKVAGKEGARVVVAVILDPTVPSGTTEASDPAAMERLGADLVFMPDIGSVYPPGFATRVIVERHNDILCAQARPGHFDSVAQLVTKLLNITGAETAYFAEKDWQQMQVMRTLVRDLDIPVRIAGCATAREQDGLAVSTRNMTLSRAERDIAPRIFAEITAAAKRISEGEPTELACAEAQENLIIAGFPKVDYLECRDAETLRLAPSPGRGARVFAAATLGRTRLIDNVPVPERFISRK